MLMKFNVAGCIVLERYQPFSMLCSVPKRLSLFFWSITTPITLAGYTGPLSTFGTGITTQSPTLNVGILILLSYSIMK
jgi:hypothetical protein